MSVVAFNTHEFIKSLMKVGIDESQAEAIAAGILRAHEMADLAKKSDLREMQMLTDARLDATDAKLDATDAKLDAIVAAVAEIKSEIKTMTKDMLEMKGGMLEMKGRISAMPSTWQLIMMVVGIMAFTTALAFTLLRLGPPQ